MKLPYRTRRRAPPEGCCPTCGQKADLGDQIFVDTSRRIAQRGGAWVYLAQHETTMLKEMLDAWPRHVTFERLAYVCWGDDTPYWATCDSPRPFNLVQMKISLLRKKLAPLGISIPRCERFIQGYVIEVDPLPKPMLVASS